MRELLMSFASLTSRARDRMVMRWAFPLARAGLSNNGSSLNMVRLWAFTGSVWTCPAETGNPANRFSYGNAMGGLLLNSGGSRSVAKEKASVAK